MPNNGPRMVSLQDLLDEISSRDEAIEGLVVKYFKLEAEARELRAKNQTLATENKELRAVAKAYKILDVFA